jgi:hypothetical protein
MDQILRFNGTYTYLKEVQNTHLLGYLYLTLFEFCRKLSVAETDSSNRPQEKKKFKMPNVHLKAPKVPDFLRSKSKERKKVGTLRTPNAAWTWMKLHSKNGAPVPPAPL